MRLIKKSKWGFAGLAVLAVGAIVALAFIVGGVGQSAIEAWVGQQLKQVAGDYLKPRLEFGTIDYQAPLTVVLTDVRLTAEDPDQPAGLVDIISAGRIRIELAELPREGKPIRLSVVEVDGADLRLIASGQGGLIGFSDLVVDKMPGDAVPLSEVLQITRVEIRDSVITYDTREPGTEPMRFDGITTTVDIDQTDGVGYALDVELKREGVLEATLVGVADLDAMMLAVTSLKARLDLSREHDRYLPPQVQTFIRQYNLLGDLSVVAKGDLNFNDVAGSQAIVDLQLKQAHGSAGGYRLPIEHLQAKASMNDRVVTLTSLDARLLGGELFGEGGFHLSDTMPAELKLSGNGLLLDQLVAAADGVGVSVAGRVDVQVNAQAPLTDVLRQMQGQGEVQVSAGRIARLPLISDLIDFMVRTRDLRPDEDTDQTQGRDRAKVVFELRGDHAYLSQADIVGTWYAMRGSGLVYFDERLKMNINAGPMEKVQESLGTIGSVFSKVTDGLLTYRVSGTMSQMKIRPIPLGGLLGAPGADE